MTYLLDTNAVIHALRGNPASVRDRLDAAGKLHGVLRHQLRHQPIGERDLLIAAIARTLGLTLVTANRKEFDRVPALAVEDWSA